MPAAQPRRIDVFSLKGGVGKTTLAILLARAQMLASKKSVLLVDADLTGTCVGDLLEWWATPGWSAQTNLAHLVCGAPERLDELLNQNLPVYVHRIAPPTNEDRSPLRFVKGGKSAKLLFCPSHAESSANKNPLVEVRRGVLQALIGHENAGGFVGHVIEQLIAKVAKLTELGGVIVDHGPGFSALQSATFASQRGVSEHRSLFVTSRDAVDLAMIHDFEKKLDLEDREHTFWVVNKTPLEGKNKIDPRFHRKLSWFEEALPFLEDNKLSQDYANAGLLEADSPNVEPLGNLRAALFV